MREAKLGCEASSTLKPQKKRNSSTASPTAPISCTSAEEIERVDSTFRLSLRCVSACAE